MPIFCSSTVLSLNVCGDIHLNTLHTEHLLRTRQQPSKNIHTMVSWEVQDIHPAKGTNVLLCKALHTKVHAVTTSDKLMPVLVPAICHCSVHACLEHTGV